MNREQAKKEIEGAERDIEDARDHLVIAKALLAAMDEDTYSIKDRFMRDKDDKHILARIDNKVVLVSLRDGFSYGDETHAVKNYQKITPAELSCITLNHIEFFTRYWDSQKNQYCNGYTKENH